ncbi:MAG: type II toxin-antitoxin system prevent-host-death family antitoxin [Cellulomonas sp.]|nr:type II toxin-antitoxin system prevent-host-death family antitoxin [Cellulomonas sp.]
MTRTVGLRELRQSASEVMRVVETGEHVIVTVAGRVVAEISPPTGRTWQQRPALAGIWNGASYGQLERDGFDDTLLDPFARPRP